MRRLREPNRPKPRVKVSMPEDYCECQPGTRAWDYLLSRGFTEEVIRDYRIGFGVQDLRVVKDRSRYAGSGRIIFPDFNSQGELVYWVARTYVNHKIKYKNASVHARDQLYNIQRASQYTSVVITEGVISAIAAGRNAIATYGKDVTPEQIAILDSCSFQKYYVALDGDATHRTPRIAQTPRALSLANSLTRRGLETYIVVLPFEDDPDSVQEFGPYLEEARRFDWHTYVELLTRRPAPLASKSRKS
jgi:DNA primase